MRIVLVKDKELSLSDQLAGIKSKMDNWHNRGIYYWHDYNPSKYLTKDNLLIVGEGIKHEEVCNFEESFNMLQHQFDSIKRAYLSDEFIEFFINNNEEQKYHGKECYVYRFPDLDYNTYQGVKYGLPSNLPDELHMLKPLDRIEFLPNKDEYRTIEWIYEYSKVSRVEKTDKWRSRQLKDATKQDYITIHVPVDYDKGFRGAFYIVKK